MCLFQYYNIILVTDESFFEAIKDNHDYRRMENWEVIDNL
jgi:hypothetical protein